MALPLPQLLKIMVDEGGTDLHVTTNSPPIIRVHGLLRRIEHPQLSPAETKQIIYSILNDTQKYKFEEHWELDFSFGGLSASEDGSGFSTNFKIGGGLSAQSMLYYTNTVVWWTGLDANVTSGISGVGYSYFLSPQSPSFFLSAALGFGFASVEDSDTESGAGLGLGAGYEFAKNWTIEANFSAAEVAEVLGITVTTSNVSLTVSWFAY